MQEVSAFGGSHSHNVLLPLSMPEYTLGSLWGMVSDVRNCSWPSHFGSDPPVKNGAAEIVLFLGLLGRAGRPLEN